MSETEFEEFKDSDDGWSSDEEDSQVSLSNGKMDTLNTEEIPLT